VRRSERRRSGRRWAIPGAALVLIAACAGAWWYWGSREPTLGQAQAAPNHTGDLPLIIEAPDQESAWDRGEPAAEQPAVADELLAPEPGPSQRTETFGADRPAAADLIASSPTSRVTGEKDHASATSSDRESAAALSIPPTKEQAVTDDPGIRAAQQQYAAGQVLEARHALNALLKKALSPTDAAEVRRLLSKIAEETIFSNRRLSGDPLVEAYRVQPGDVLERIGQQYRVPPEILMRVNGIADATRLRADANIKVLRGPFHARIVKSEFRMDVYLQDLYVRSFRVGLGADQGTPEGVWRVKERLTNPTYYPPPSAQTKRIIAPDDPENPLGEHWIGLEGIEGDAVGRYGFGIHGTIEPESVGKAVSLGCIRLLNEDVALLYALLLPGHSTVTIVP